MTSKSKLENIAAPPQCVTACGAVPMKPGTATLRSTPAHRVGHHDVDRDVDQRRGGEGLEHLEGEFLHGARARGELHQADGERDRAVLDDVEEFRRERRQDDAVGHRQERVDVGLRQRQPERQRRHALAARQREDAGAHLLGDARRGVEAERDHGGVERGVGQLLEPVADRAPAPAPAARSTRGTSAPAAGCCGTAPHRRCRADEPRVGRGADDADERAEHERQIQAQIAVASVQPVPRMSVCR